MVGSSLGTVSHVAICDIDEGSVWGSVGKWRDNSTIVETTGGSLYHSSTREMKELLESRGSCGTLG